MCRPGPAGEPEGVRIDTEQWRARGKKVTADFSHRNDQPGVYFATVRVTDSTAVHGAKVSGIQNLASVRVIVARPAAGGRSN
jgi:hypothetical protein